MMARVEASQEQLNTFWSVMAEQASEVPLPACLASVGFEDMKLPRIVLDAEMKKDNEKMVIFLLIDCLMILTDPYVCIILCNI